MDTGTNLSSNKEKKNEVGTTSIERPTNPTIRFRNRFKVNTRPDVDVESLAASERIQFDGSANEIAVNAPYTDLNRSLYGSETPQAGQVSMRRNYLTGHVDKDSISDYHFTTQERTFKTLGYARDPSITTTNRNGDTGAGIDGTGFVGDVAKALENKGATILEMKGKLNQHLRRKKKGDVSVLDGDNAYMGPWAGYEDEIIGDPVGPSEEQLAEYQRSLEAAAAASKARDAAPERTETTKFHGKELFDYMGRTYMDPPQDIGVNFHAIPGDQECQFPKKHLHTYRGHTKGVNAVRFLPKSAHLILSCSMDSKVKIWDVYKERRCLRTYMGHDSGVRDICFTNDGKHFLTASFDRHVKLWDTETGQCIQGFSSDSIPYCVRFNPDDDKQHLFLASCADHKVYQFDTKSGEIVQEYNEHLGAVNSITFVDDNRRFVTTSDDKSLRAFEFDIPVSIKIIAEPTMHSMPCVALHPNKKYILCQSLDNHIYTFGARDRFSMNGKKKFRGHLVAGYACQVSCSPDGKYVISGDSEGMLWGWSWRTCKVVRKLRAHDQVVIGCEWHPLEESKVATCSWDSTIKLWE